MEAGLFFLFSTLLYLYLNACNGTHTISRMEQGGKENKNKNREPSSADDDRPNDYNILALVFSALNAASQAKQRASSTNSFNQKIQDTYPIKKVPVQSITYYNDQQPIQKVIIPYGAQNSYTEISPSATSPNNATRSINISGPIPVTGIIPTIRSYADKLSTYVLATKIMLERPDLAIKIASKQGPLVIKLPLEGRNGLVINHIIDLAKYIIDYSTILFKKSECTNCINYILKCIDSTIDKNYINIIDFVLNSTDFTIDDIANRNIMDFLQSILKSTNDTINKIDAEYFETDEVFFNEDKFASFHKQTYDAFKKANEADECVQNAWERIILLQHLCPVEGLQETLDLIINAGKAAKAAGDAYHRFAEYLGQFIPTIQKLLQYCGRLFEPEIKKMLHNCDECMNIVQLTVDEETVHLGVDIQAVQDTLDNLSAVIRGFK